MKKIIIAVALVLVSVVTAFSLTRAENKPAKVSIKTEEAAFDVKDSSTPKSDIATAD